MLEELVWKTVVPGLQEIWIRARPALAAELRAHKPTVDQRVKELLPSVLSQLENRVQTREVSNSSQRCRPDYQQCPLGDRFFIHSTLNA